MKTYCAGHVARLTRKPKAESRKQTNSKRQERRILEGQATHLVDQPLPGLLRQRQLPFPFRLRLGRRRGLGLPTLLCLRLRRRRLLGIKERMLSEPQRVDLEWQQKGYDAKVLRGLETWDGQDEGPKDERQADGKQQQRDHQGKPGQVRTCRCASAASASSLRTCSSSAASAAASSSSRFTSCGSGQHQHVGGVRAL